MHFSRSTTGLGIALLLLFAGCVGSNAPAATTATSGMVMPPPKVLWTKDLDACPQDVPGGGSPPVQTAAVTQIITVDDAYDEIAVTFHATGVGNVSASVRSQESGKNIWAKSETVNTVASGTNCGDHSHKGGGDPVSIESGTYTVNIQYAGAVAVHMDILERIHGSNDSSMQHMH